MTRYPIVNALTGFEHKDKFVGTTAELEFYRVMPEGRSRKIFFDTADEYAAWRKMQYGGDEQTVPHYDGAGASLGSGTEGSSSGAACCSPPRG